MYLDQKHYEGDEDEQSPPPGQPPPPPPRPPGSPLTNLVIGGSLVMLVLLVAAKKPQLRGPMFGLMLLMLGLYAVIRFTMRQMRRRDRGLDYDGRPYETVGEEIEDGIFGAFFSGLFKMIGALFSWGSKND